MQLYLFMHREIPFRLQILNLNRVCWLILPEALERIAPVEANYHHDEMWHDGNGYAHVRASIVGNSTHVPLIDGVLQLGQWQQVVLIDFDNKARAKKLMCRLFTK